MSEEIQSIEHEEGAVVPYHPLPPPSVFGTNDPLEVIEKASRIAEALKKVIVAQGLISKIQGKEYPRCEAWTLLGTMLGIFPVTVWTRPMEGGWEARTEARTLNGTVLGAAEAMCLRSERNWRDREDFALRSMAATRSVAKALRMPLGFVMSLSGFQATPAEEMDFDREPNQPKQITAPGGTSKRADGAKAPSAALPEPTEAQRLKFIALLKPLGQDALDYAYDNSWLLPPSDDGEFPGEPIETLDLKHVPRTKRQADAILAEIQARMDGDLGPQKPAGASGPPSDLPADTAEAGSDAGKGQPRSKSGHSDASGQDSDADAESDVETMVGRLEEISEKSGRSSKGPWTRFGFKVAGSWFSTFDKTLATCAAQDRGHSVRVHFKRGDKGNTLVGIERAKSS
jgi:hypothetical protein